MNSRISACSMVFLLVLLLSSSLFSSSEDKYDMQDSECWYGIYVGDAKVGFQYIKLERKKVNEEYYRITATEERVSKVADKEVKESSEYNATIGMDFVPLKFECIETKGSKKNTIKATVKSGTADITVAFGSSPAMPAQKLKLTIGANWGFIAPFCFAFANKAADKAADLVRINEMGKVVTTLSLAPKKATDRFQGEKIEFNLWNDADMKTTLASDDSGKLLWFTETIKLKGMTTYISETEEVAKSAGNFDAFKKQPGEKTGKERKIGNYMVVSTKVEGSRFADALDPVEPDTEDNEYGRGMGYWKDSKKGYSMKLLDDWNIVIMNRLPVASPEFFPKYGITIRQEEMDEEMTAAEFLVSLFKKDDAGIEAESDVIEEYQFDDNTLVAGMMVNRLLDDGNMKEYLLIGVRGSNAFIVSCFQMMPEQSNWDDHEEDYYKMMGSFRILPEE